MLMKYSILIFNVENVTGFGSKEGNGTTHVLLNSAMAVDFFLKHGGSI